MADYTTKGSFNLGNQITLKNKNSNIDRDYGPYENKTLEEIAEELKDTLQIGKTIGVIENGKVVEYWWLPGEEAGDKDVLVYYDSDVGKYFSCNYIGKREDIYDTLLYEWENDGGAKVYTKTKNSTSAENGVYRLVDGDLYFIAPIDRIVHPYAFVKKGGSDEEGSKIVVDSELSLTSTNPIQNQAVANALGGKADSSTVSSINTRVGTLETTITSKADNSAVEALQTAVEGINTSIPMVVVNGNEYGDCYIKSNEYSILAGDFIEYITIRKNYVEIEGAVNHYMIRFTYKSEYVSVSFVDWELQWAGGNEPEWEVGKTYEVSIIDNIALWAEIG